MDEKNKYHIITKHCEKCSVKINVKNYKKLQRQLICTLDGEWFVLWFYRCPTCKHKTLFLKEDTSEQEEKDKIYSIGM